MKGDFHMHSTCSDGGLKPGEVVLLARERKIDFIALTDHNTTKGVDEAIKVGNIYGVKVIPGMELSTRHKGNRVHVLGYFRDESYKEEKFLKCLRYFAAGNAKKAMEVINYEVSLACEGGKPTTQSGIKFLRYFRCVVILAHPVSLDRKVFNNIVDFGFDGIEAKYFRNKEEDTEYFLKVAKEKQMIYTAGTDFHTNKKVDLKHGTLGQIYLEGEELEVFLEYLL